QAETGNIRVHVADVPLRAILSNALDAVKASAQERSIRWDVRTEGAPERLSADADKAVWVVVNLLSNAVHYSPQGGTISITGIRSDGELHLTVSDQGPGIPPAEQAQLFQRFAHTASSSPQSTGLGLAIAREFMEAMGGAIAFDPGVTTGASFILRFPATD
ncbi:MAG TPA: ATP-binding protein, partial [Flavobacteriales bacterium]|nr:ATP-binding protein [Flavobacteriales bacterium]